MEENDELTIDYTTEPLLRKNFFKKTRNTKISIKDLIIKLALIQQKINKKVIKFQLRNIVGIIFFQKY